MPYLSDFQICKLFPNTPLANNTHIVSRYHIKFYKLYQIKNSLQYFIFDLNLQDSFSAWVCKMNCKHQYSPFPDFVLLVGQLLPYTCLCVAKCFLWQILKQYLTASHSQKSLKTLDCRGLSFSPSTPHIKQWNNERV